MHPVIAAVAPVAGTGLPRPWMSIRSAPTWMRSIRSVKKVRWRAADNSDQLLRCRWPDSRNAPVAGSFSRRTRSRTRRRRPWIRYRATVLWTISRNVHFAVGGAVWRALIIDPLPRNAGDITAVSALEFDQPCGLLLAAVRHRVHSAELLRRLEVNSPLSPDHPEPLSRSAAASFRPSVSSQVR
jgi:hypothetical protein